MIIPNLLKLQAKRQGEKPAIREPQKSKKRYIQYTEKSFLQLDEAVDKLAAYFQHKGLETGKTVLLMLQPSSLLIEIIFALMKIGSIPILLDPGLGLKSYLKCIQTTRPDYLICSYKGYTVSLLFPGSFRSIQKKICIQTFFKSKVYAHKNTKFYNPITSTDNIAAILFTSGSTGIPKGVVYTHAQFLAQIELLKKTYHFQKNEIDLPLLPIFALFNPILGMLTVIPEINPSKPAKLNPQKIVQAIIQNEVTSSFGAPPLWNKIASYCKENKIVLPSIKRILIAGTSVHPKIIKNVKDILPNGEVYTPYGATEALPISSLNGSYILKTTAHLSLEGKGTCVGKPLEGIKIKIIDNKGHSLENTKIGEITVQGPNVTNAYYKLPQITQNSKILDNGQIWHKMGDMGYLDEDGYLWFCSRKAELVETDKETLYTDMCEPIINQHPWVYRSALISIKNNKQQEAAIVIEPLRSYFPKNKLQKALFIKEVAKLCNRYPSTQPIRNIFFSKQLEVDIRHNAKIHRLKITKKYSKKFII